MIHTFRVLLADVKGSEVSAYIPGLFKKAGCAVDVFCGNNSWLLKNKSYDTWHQVHDKTPEKYAKELQQLVSEQNYDWVVLTDDFVIRIMNNEITDQGMFKKILPLQEEKNRNLLGSKAGLSKFCLQHNIPTPTFVICDNEEKINSLGDNIPFPVLLKIDKSGGGKGVFVAADKIQAKEIFTALSAEQKNNLVIQEYIEGDNVAVEALFKNGILLGYSSSVVLNNVDGEFSVSAVREYKKISGVEELISSFGSAAGLNGFSSMTLMRSNKNTMIYLVESDMRPHGWFYLAKFAGVDFSRLINVYLLGNLDAHVPVTNQNQEIVRYFSRDIKSLIKKGNFLGAMQWLINKDKRWRYIPWRDQKLFWSFLVDTARHSLYSIKPLRTVLSVFQRWNKSLIRTIHGFLN